MSLALYPSSSCESYDHTSVSEFAAKVLSVIESDHSRQKISTAISTFLPIDRQSLLDDPDALFDVVCAKMVLECRVLGSADSAYRFCDQEYGQLLKKMSFQEVVESYQIWRSHNSFRQPVHYAQEYLELYDDALAAFSRPGVGLLLAQRLCRRFNLPSPKFNSQTMVGLVDFVERLEFCDFWMKLREESDIFVSTEMQMSCQY